MGANCAEVRGGLLQLKTAVFVGFQLFWFGVAGENQIRKPLI